MTPASQVEQRFQAELKQKHEDRRFTAAVAAMQGLLSCSYEGWEPWKPCPLAEEAIIYADALLAELSTDG